MNPFEALRKMTGTCEHLMTTTLLISIRKTTQYGLITLLCFILIYLSNWSSVVKEFGLLAREWVIAEFQFPLLSSYPQHHKCIEINLFKAFWSHLLPFLLRCPFVILCLNNLYQICIFWVKKWRDLKFSVSGHRNRKFNHLYVGQ